MELRKTSLPFWRFKIDNFWRGAKMAVAGFGFVLFFRHPRYEFFEDFHGMKERGEIIRKGGIWRRVKA